MDTRWIATDIETFDDLYDDGKLQANTTYSMREPKGEVIFGYSPDGVGVIWYTFEEALENGVI